LLLDEANKKLVGTPGMDFSPQPGQQVVEDARQIAEELQ
jgi:hypothetical protein